MRQFVRALVAAVLVVTVGMVVPAAALPTSDPEPVTQQRIGELIKTIISLNNGQSAESIEEQADTLLRSVEGDRERLLQQLWIHRARNPGNEIAMSAALLLSYYDFTPPEIREALTPLLETDDASVRSSVLELLSSIDSANGAQPDPGLYDGILDRHEQAPLGLIRYLYSLSPIAALTVTARRYMAHDEAEAAIQPALALELSLIHI